mmetsp:Transcript_12859/g.31230  ORF Transcript_12859/g.31230 Transcript_12859/m.31230 type:complete len:326 (-) Transcript_12859:180-1157(-)
MPKLTLASLAAIVEAQRAEIASLKASAELLLNERGEAGGGAQRPPRNYECDYRWTREPAEPPLPPLLPSLSPPPPPPRTSAVDHSLRSVTGAGKQSSSRSSESAQQGRNVRQRLTTSPTPTTLDALPDKVKCQYIKFKKVMVQLSERNVRLNHPPGRIFVNQKGKTMQATPCKKVSEIAEGFKDHVGRHVLKLVDGFGWMRAYVERKAQPGEMPACNVGKHAVQFHLKFMNLKKFEHATKMSDHLKIYSDYFWLEEEELAGRLLFLDHDCLGWSRKDFVPKKLLRDNISAVYSPEMLRLVASGQPHVTCPRTTAPFGPFALCPWA